jgi:nucleoside-diphosphate-sugar epimerase
MSRARALVTGGCGFVGRHFSRWLLDHGYDVTIVDDLSSGLPLDKWPSFLMPVNSDHIHAYYKDFRDFAKESPARFDLILHLAAVVGGRLMIDGDPLRVATDLAIDATFFNWLARHKAPAKVLYFSSSAAYPTCEQTEFHHRPLNEDLIDFDKPLGVPDMTYGWAKLSGEFLAHHARETYGMDIVVYRPFSGYGEDQDFSYPFPSIVRRVGRREFPITVWGSGRQLRDFIHIDDVVESVFASAWKAEPGQALNLGSGVGTSFTELAKMAGRLIGHESSIVNDASKPEGVFARVGDCGRIFEYYRPIISLEEGLERVYRYQLATGEIHPSSIAVA